MAYCEGCGRTDPEQPGYACEYCGAAGGDLECLEEQAHEGHYSLWGSWWCDTCDSPYCELA